MEILWIILIGAIIGFLGRLVAGRDVSWIATILVGIVGNIIGFYVWRAIGGGNDLIGYVFGVIAAALLIVGLTNVTRRRI
jgi:uncharacterized membrane protein YeaQ/YmgE (transglycosylase-associated protein family)